jgi:hypothetical protein
MNLPKNLGPTDRALRIALGYVMLFNFVWFPFTGDFQWLAIAGTGLIPLLTGLFGTCLLYVPVGLSTAPKPSAA